MKELNTSQLIQKLADIGRKSQEQSQEKEINVLIRLAQNGYMVHLSMGKEPYLYRFGEEEQMFKHITEHLHPEKAEPKPVKQEPPSHSTVGH